ncbi:MAG: sigma-70 family RNA polymerase sigma factor, partial [Leptospiraceae bacterium]|nr:sigma-70 family RNA polymerase sigma factor [Leptospiraceae bacterium]
MILPFIVLWLWFQAGYLIPLTALYLFVSGKWLSALNARGKQPSHLIRIITTPVYVLYPINVFVHRLFNIVSYKYNQPFLAYKENKALRRFLKKVRDYEKVYKNFGDLSREEQVDLIQKAQKGDKEARDRIVTSNLRLVMSIAKEYLRSEIILTDLLQQGSVGILLGLEKFDISRNVPFHSYISWWIKGQIKDHIRGLKPLSINNVADGEMAFYKNVYEKLYSETGVVPSPDKIARRMNDIRRKRFIQRIKKKEKRLPTKKEIEALKLITVDRVKKIAKLESSSFFSLDAPPAGSQNEIYFKESIEDENAESPSKQAEGMILDEISQILTKREYKVMEIRFGLKDGVSHSREHIAREFNMTTENVRLILKEIFRKLRFRLKNRTKLLAYLERQKEKLRNSSEEDTRTDVVEKKVSEENIGRLSAKIHELETVAHDPNILNPESMLLQSADVLEEILKEMAIFKTILLVEISIIMSQYLTKYSLTMEKAAKQTGISVTMISNIFNKNYNSISYKYLDKIING